MKFSHLLLTASLTFSSYVFAGEKGHGGDPLKIYAEAYPQPAKLLESINLVEEKVNGSLVDDSFKHEVFEELEYLARNDSFMYIENLLIIDTDGTDHLHGDFKTFTSFGGMTDYQKGSVVYLSKRTLAYDQNQLGQLILHEILHHMFKRELSKDEALIDITVRSIWENISYETVNTAIRKGRNKCSLTSQKIYSIFKDTIVVLNRARRIEYKFNENMSLSTARKEFLGGAPLGLHKLSLKLQGSGVGSLDAGEARTVYQAAELVLHSIDRKCTLD